MTCGMFTPTPTLPGYLLIQDSTLQVEDYRHQRWKNRTLGETTLALRHLSLQVLSRGWLIEVTRKYIYNRIRGPKQFRFDIRILNGHKSVAHGILGQSWDGDAVGVSGKVDDYTPNHVVTTAMAEGAIEGVAEDYILPSPRATEFKYSCFRKSSCPLRDTSRLMGSHRTKSDVAEATTTES